MPKNTTIYTLFMLLLASKPLFAQPKVTPYYPTKQQITEAYLRQYKLDSVVRSIPLNSTITPNWQQQQAFWYTKRLPGNKLQYYYVDAQKGTKQLAFNTSQFAAAITKATGKPTDTDKLVISKLFFSNAQQCTFKYKDTWLQCNVNTYTCQPTNDTLFTTYDNEKPLQSRTYRWENVQRDSVSPDKKWLAFSKQGNLFVRNLQTLAETQLSTDGTPQQFYGEFSWSPDSKRVIGFLIQPQEVKKVYYVLSSVPGTTRGQLKSHDYEQPGDAMTTYTPYVFNVEQKQAIKINTDKIDFFGAPQLHWRAGSNQYFTFEKVDRGHQRFRVIEANVYNGNTSNIIDEKTATFIYEQRLYTHYLPQTNEVVWITEQDGWRHIYLVNSVYGMQKLVTKGNWVVRDIDSVDAKKREIWFTASGLNPTEDPYFIHYYRIGFDGKNLINLTPAQGNHKVVFSPDRKYYIDTYSQVNVPPVTQLRQTSNAKLVLSLEKTDANPLLAAGLKMPQVFVAKARDGKTDIWGVVYRPSNFDSTKSYPIIENIYAGPQDSFVPENFSPVNEMQSIAELGFIVVQMDGMGTANRSKAFHDVCWKNLADAGFPDRILWMKALACQYPQADTTRVGVYGTSAGGQNAAGAVLFHPEFYKAAVSACGCQDNRIDKQWWNEQWMGYPVGPHYAQQSNITNAYRLKGNLLLIVGEADENVPPESTYRFVDALIKSNKNFDLLTVPGMGHSDGGNYGRRKKRDFFVEHLLQVSAPNRTIGEH